LRIHRFFFLAVRDRVKGYFKGAAKTSAAALYFDCAAVKIDKMLRNGQTQAKPAKLPPDGWISLLERREKGALPFDFDSDPIIGDLELETSAIVVARADVDLSADLYEIQPDGTSVALWSDIRRLRYRESLREAKPVKPGEIVKCDFNPGLFVARRLMKGSRLRLVVTAVNSIAWQKNYCSGGVVAEETAKDARTCHVHVYQDAPHASAIQLPLREPGTLQK